MKKQSVWILFGGMALLLFLSFNQGRTADEAFPKEIGAILESSCYNCHATGSRSEDALKAFQFDLWDDYRVTKKIGLLGKICEMVEEGKMPPGKYLERNPDKKLTEAQKKLLCDWTKKESERLMQDN